MENIDTLVNNYFNKAVEDLRRLIQINSIYDASSADSSNPFGIGAAECLNSFLNLANDDGFSVKNIDNYAGYVECGSGELLGILAHLDTVTTGNESLWTYPPFSAEIHDNKLYGRGAVDDKGPLIAAYTALKILKDNYQLNKRFRIITGCDEETSIYIDDSYHNFACCVMSA